MAYRVAMRKITLNLNTLIKLSNKSGILMLLRSKRGEMDGWPSEPPPTLPTTED